MRDLSQKCTWEDSLVVDGNETVEYQFRYFPGKDYEFVLNNPGEFELLSKINPDVIVHMVLLGSTEYLNHHQYFTDGVHLQGEGLKRYQAAIIGEVKYAMGK